MTTSSAHLFANAKHVFLDRDGVINRKLPEGEYIHNWDHFELLPGVESAIATLNRHCRVIVVSNQRGVALGFHSRNDVEAVHSRLQEHLATRGAHIDAFYYCPHDENQCNCRKPQTGLFEQAFRDFPAATTSNSVLIGDGLADIEAAQTLSIPSIFIEGDPQTRKPGAEKAAAMADAKAHSLLEAVEKYLNR